MDNVLLMVHYTYFKQAVYVYKKGGLFFRSENKKMTCVLHLFIEQGISLERIGKDWEQANALECLTAPLSWVSNFI